MNYKIYLKVNNKTIENEVLDLEQLNGAINAFNKCLNRDWKDDNITLHIETTNEKALSKEEYIKKSFRDILNALFGLNDK